MALIEGNDLVGRKELSDLLHIRTTNIGNWRDRRHIIGFPDILPLGLEGEGLSMGPIWDIVEVLDWWLNWTPKPGHTKQGYLDDPDYWDRRIKDRIREQNIRESQERTG